MSLSVRYKSQYNSMNLTVGQVAVEFAADKLESGTEIHHDVSQYLSTV